MSDTPTPEQLLCQMMLVRSTEGLSTSPAQFWLLYRAARARSAVIIHNHHDEAVAYILLAQVAKEGMRSFLATGLPPAYDYEWGEGRLNLVIDVVISKRHRDAAMPKLRQLLAQHRAVAFVRRAQPRLYVRWQGRLRKQPHASHQVATSTGQ